MAKVELYPHQVDNAQALYGIIKTRGVALDCSETGTGKSYTALAVAKVLKRKPFVFCPLSVGPSWEQKFKDAGIRGGRWINYEKARRSNFKMPDDSWFVIWDECHRCKAASSKQAKLMTRVAPRYPSLLLSATPFSSPLETRALMHVMGIREWQRWYSILPQLGCFQNANLHNAWMWRGNPEDVENLRALFANRMVKTRWRDVDGFPDNVVLADAVRIKDRDKFNELYEAVASTNKLTEQLHHRMLIEHHRVPAMVDMATDLLAQGISPVAFFNFTEPLLEYAEAMDTDNIIKGTTPKADRAKIIKKFQGLDIPCPMVCNIKAGGEGIDLHDTVGVPRVSLLSPTWSAQDLKQALGRIHRAGAKSRAVQRILFAAGTVEDSVLKTVGKKLANIDKLTDNDLTVTHVGTVTEAKA